MSNLYWWDYRCESCCQSGSCPVSDALSMFEAVEVVRKAHAAFNPQCDRDNAGQCLTVFGVGRQR